MPPSPAPESLFKKISQMIRLNIIFRTQKSIRLVIGLLEIPLSVEITIFSGIGFGANGIGEPAKGARPGRTAVLR
ncbi:hypothetical protein [Paraburkholderia fungorum]|uniref:hypothetical protein n=1 Tax=Paraburkholderia fungorum TaxID=134537 RepID=UPI0011C44388|nr:hypothetical protein [Paraburkholderia fungorum]